MRPRTYTQEEVSATIALHRRWLCRDPGGERANFSEAPLSGAHLRGTDLSGADFRGANLSGADLSGANLSEAGISEANLSGANLHRAVLDGAVLREADLSGASLVSASLHRANLSGATLRGADLSGSSLSGADLSGADLTDAIGLPEAPSTPDIHRAILAACMAEGAGLNMDVWHGCETTHCRAGWAIHLAGKAGYALEERLGPSVAGALIYHASDPANRVPNFGGSEEEAMADMRRLAGVE